MRCRWSSMTGDNLSINLHGRPEGVSWTHAAVHVRVRPYQTL